MDPIATEQHSAPGFWRRRVLDVILAQLRQGITPHSIALTIALGSVIAVLPLLGVTSLLCAVVAAWLRLNQPIMQLTNWLCYPLQLILLIPYYRAGEWFGAPRLTLSIPQLVQRFEIDPIRFIGDFAGVALGGIAAWLITAPLAVLPIYGVLKPALRRLHERFAAKR